MTQKMTMADIARLAGVSTPTVSRVLNDSPLVNEVTRARVLDVIRKHDYRINEGARNLRLKQTGTVAVIWSSDPGLDQSLSDPFLLPMLGKIADTVERHGYDCLLTAGHTRGGDLFDSYLRRRKADGLIVIGQGRSDAALREIAERGAPIVVWGAVVPGQPYCAVGSDNTLGGYLAARHLIEGGSRNLVFLGDTGHLEIALRYQGFERALAERPDARAAADPVAAHFSSRSGFELVAELLDRGVEFDGIVASSDAIAMGAIRAVVKKGRAVPVDVAVVGYDDIPSAAYFHPPLSTIHQDTAIGGVYLAERLLALLAGEPAAPVILPTELIVRESSRRVRGKDTFRDRTKRSKGSRRRPR